MVDFTGFLTQLVRESPVLGVFLASVIGNVIPFFPVPYLLVVVLVASTTTGFGLIPLVVISALGAAIGKFSSYTLGYGTGRIFRGSRARFESLKKLLGGSVFLTAVLFAASPLPDDFVFVPLGMMRYSPLKTFISLLAGKFVLTIFVAYTAKTVLATVASVSGESILALAISAGITIMVGLIMIRIDWEKVLLESQKHGLRSLVKRLFGKRDTSARRP